MRTRLYTAGVVLGLGAVAALAVLLVAAGRLDPSPPSLERHPVPEIPGWILYVGPDGCVIRARASGEQREAVACPGTDVVGLSWLDAGTVAYVEAVGGQAVVTTVSLETGESATRPWAGHVQRKNLLSVQGERVDFDEEGSVYVVQGTDRVKVLDFDGPEYSRPYFVTWSPDGGWLLLAYTGELWVVSRDGRVAGTLARTARGSGAASWWIDGYGYLPEVMPPPPAQRG